MKQIFKKLILFAFILFLSVGQLLAQIPNDVVDGLKNGNASALSNYFNQNIELTVLDNDNVYSKAQAQQILAGFFNQYKVSDFELKYEIDKESSKHVIGTLTTDNGTFRVSFLMKTDEEKAYIHQLRVEKQ